MKIKIFLALVPFILVLSAEAQNGRVKVAVEVEDETPGGKFANKIQLWMEEALRETDYEVVQKAPYTLKGKLLKIEEGTIGKVPTYSVVFSLTIQPNKKEFPYNHILLYKKFFDGTIDEAVKEVVKDAVNMIDQYQNPPQKVPSLPPNIRGIPV